MSSPKVTKSTRMYSWWWDSHISPKNSKWLKENLEDMDDRVRTMIKLIDQDADSFGRRAEMYYQKRPELMKLVEEFYREYRALAERYDHVTGALYQAHCTIFKAFPNQISPPPNDDSTTSSLTQVDPQTPYTHALSFTPDDLDSIEYSLPDLPSGKPIFTANSVKKILKFDELGEDNQTDPFSDSIISYEIMDEENKPEDGVEKLKEALSKLQDEHDTALIKYQTALDKLHGLESELSHARSDCRKHSAQASKAEKEVDLFRENLARLQAEEEDAMLCYKKCIDKMCDLKEELASQVYQSEIEAGIALMTLKDEEASLLSQQDIIPTLEKKLLQTEEELEREKERAGKGEKEAESLERARILERDEAVFKCGQHEEKISTLEREIVCLQGEANRLYVEVDEGAVRLKTAEQCCLLLKNANQSLHSKIESLLLKLGTQCQEITEKQKELGNLWTCVQEERFKLKEVETAFEALQFLHFQSQEQVKFLSTKLEEESRFFSHEKEENNRLNELGLSLSLSMNAARNENNKLRENNAILETSLSDMSTELEAVREKMKAMEETCRSLLFEKSTLENSLSDARTELEGTKAKLKECEEKCDILEKEREFMSRKIGESHRLLTQLSSEVEEELGRNISSQIEILVLQKYIEASKVDMKELWHANNALRGEAEKHKSESVLWEKEMATVLSNLQACSVREAFFVKKTAELAALCREVSSDQLDQNNARTMVELWETSDQDGSIDLRVARVGKANDRTTPVQAPVQAGAGVKVLKEGKDLPPAMEGSFGKSEKWNEECWEEEDRGKVLERLQFDAQKLNNLRITLDDLKIEVTKNKKRGKAGEYDGIEGQLDGMDATVLKLLDVIWKLKAVQEKDGRDVVRIARNASLRQRVLAQARRVSDRIGRLQAEVQKIQFMLVRGNNGRKRFRIYTRKTRVLLQDFLSHSLRTSERRRRNVFCACAEPRTSGD